MFGIQLCRWGYGCIHTSCRMYTLLNVVMSDHVKRDNVIRSFLNGWSWNEHPNIVLHRKLLSADHSTEWMRYNERFPYVIDYHYTIYHHGSTHRGTLVFTDGKDKLLLVEGLSVVSDQLQYGGSRRTRQKLRNRKRKTLRERVHTLAQLIHSSNQHNIVSTEGVIVTDSDISHVITVPASEVNKCTQQTFGDTINSTDDGWRHCYWPRNTSQTTCVERDKVLRTYFSECDWSNDPEFNIIRRLLLSPSSNTCYTEKYPLFYDYQYIVPLENGVVCEGDCLFTDGENNFMAVEVKSLLPGELHSPHRLGSTARKARQDKRKMVTRQAAFYAEKWHENNAQVARTEGIVATEHGLQHVVTLDQ